MCDKAVDTYNKNSLILTIKFVSECFTTQELSDQTKRFNEI